jgi:hypothetical protein
MSDDTRDQAGDERTAEQRPHRTPTAYEAARVTAARTPSAEAAEAVEAAADQQADGGSGTSGEDTGAPRTAKEIVNDADHPLSPLAEGDDPVEQGDTSTP